MSKQSLWFVPTTEVSESLGMIRLFTILILLFSFNGWANNEYNQCLEMAEATKETILVPADWDLIERSINREERGLDEEAKAYAATVPVRAVGSGSISRARKFKAKEYKQKRLVEIQAKRNQLEKDKQADLEKVAMSKREATKLYIEIMKLCNDLK